MIDRTPEASAVPSWRSPAMIITAGCMIALLTFGVRAGFGLFLEPMSTDLGWSREAFAFAIALQNLLWGAGQPAAGALADRYGSGKVLAIGGLSYALGLMLMSVGGSPALFTLSAGVLVGLGLSGASFTIVLAAIGRSVPPEKRSWALGLGTAAGSLGQFLVAPLGQAFISAYGWSAALLILSAMVALVLPLATVLSGKPPEAPDGPDETIGEAIRRAFGHSSYVLLVIGFFVCGFHVAFIQTHLPAYLQDLGLAASLGAWSIAAIGLFNVIGSYGAGVLGGTHSKKNMLAGIYAVRALVIALFVLVPATPASVLLFSAAIGVLWLSTVPLTSGLVAMMFGPRYMATLFGFVFFSHQIGAFLGVWLGGALYDRVGSYDVVWWLSVALGIVAAIVHWPIKETPAALRTAPAAQ